MSMPEAMRGHGTGSDSSSSDMERRGQYSKGKGFCYQQNREGRDADHSKMTNGHNSAFIESLKYGFPGPNSGIGL